MRKGVTVILGLLLCACESERTVYDEFGRVVPEDTGGGGERSFEQRLEENFDKAVTVKKTKNGVPQSYSDMVSSYQGKLDESTRLDKTFPTGQYYGGESTPWGSTKRFDWDKSTDFVRKDYKTGRRMEHDLHPAFATGSRGIYSVDDDAPYAAVSAEGYSGRKSPINGTAYAVGDSPVYTHDTRSGYIEAHSDDTPPPPIYSKGDYYSKTINETRAMLGR